MTRYARSVHAVGSVSTGPIRGPRSSGLTRVRYVVTPTLQTRFRPREPADGGPIPVIASPNLAAAAGPGGVLPVQIVDQQFLVRVVGVAKRFPTLTGSFVVADESWLLGVLNGAVPGSGQVEEVWVDGRRDPGRRRPGAGRDTVRRAHAADLQRRRRRARRRPAQPRHARHARRSRDRRARPGARRPAARGDQRPARRARRAARARGAGCVSGRPAAPAAAAGARRRDRRHRRRAGDGRRAEHARRQRRPADRRCGDAGPAAPTRRRLDAPRRRAPPYAVAAIVLVGLVTWSAFRSPVASSAEAAT